MFYYTKQLSIAASNQAHYFLWQFKEVKPATNVIIVPNIVIAGFMLASSTFMLSILEFIFMATFHKHRPFAITNEAAKDWNFYNCHVRR